MAAGRGSRARRRLLGFDALTRALDYTPSFARPPATYFSDRVRLSLFPGFHRLTPTVVTGTASSITLKQVG
ncbi:hypothetical protein BD309DRAFT_955164 [Dichomitus squalens]|nr:hypothetical protein BD309DRAFT_955164 [Dichomitus squalens]